MAKSSGLGNRFYVGGYDLSGDVGAINTAASRRELLVITGLDKLAYERINGRSDGELSFSTFFNKATDREHELLSLLPTTDQISTYLQSESLGDVVAQIIGKQVNYDWSRGVDGSLGGTTQILSNGSPLEWGFSLTAGKRTDVAPTNGASVDDLLGIPISTSFGLAACLHVFSVTGTSVTVKIQDSANNVDFTDLASFTAVAPAGAPSSERITTSITQTVRRYLRAITEGTFSEAIIAVSMVRFLAAQS